MRRPLIASTSAERTAGVEPSLDFVGNEVPHHAASPAKGSRVEFQRLSWEQLKRLIVAS